MQVGAVNQIVNKRFPADRFRKKQTQKEANMMLTAHAAKAVKGYLAFNDKVNVDGDGLLIFASIGYCGSVGLTIHNKTQFYCHLLIDVHIMHKFDHRKTFFLWRIDVVRNTR